MKQTIKSNLKKLFVSVLSIMVFLSGLGSTGIVAMAEVLSSVDSLNGPNIKYYTGGNYTGALYGTGLEFGENTKPAVANEWTFSHNLSNVTARGGIYLKGPNMNGYLTATYKDTFILTEGFTATYDAYYSTSNKNFATGNLYLGTEIGNISAGIELADSAKSGLVLVIKVDGTKVATSDKIFDENHPLWYASRDNGANIEYFMGSYYLGKAKPIFTLNYDPATKVITYSLDENGNVTTLTYTSDAVDLSDATVVLKSHSTWSTFPTYNSFKLVGAPCPVHEYDDGNDTTCNKCGEVRTIGGGNEPGGNEPGGGESAPEVGEALTALWAPESFVAADWCDTKDIVDGRFVIPSSQGTKTIWTTKNYDLSNGFIFKGTLSFKNGYNNFYGEWCSAYFGTETKNLELRIKNDSLNNSVKDNTYTAYLLYSGQELANYDLLTLPNGEYGLTYKEGKVSVSLGNELLNWTLADGSTTTEVPVTADLTNAKLGLRLMGNYCPNGREWANISIKPICDHITDGACDLYCNRCGDALYSTAAHTFDNGCDTDCNICGFERITYHIYDDVNDSVCNECGYIRNLSSLPKGVCGTNLNWVFDNGTGTLYISGEGAMYNYSQGSYYTPSDYTVGTEVAPWSVYKNQILNIVIDDDVTSIGSYAFYGCNAVKKITLPFVGKTADSNTYFGYIFGAPYFSSNYSYVPSSLKEVVITKATSIGSYAFYYCRYITSITIPDSVTYIGSDAFYDCNSLTNITIPDGVTSIYSDTFYNCTNLINIDLPDRQVSFNDDAFYGTAAYNNSANWQDGVFYLDNHLILYTGNPTTVTVKDGTKYIANSAFYNCYSLTSITIPDSVTYIGNSTFYNCYSLTSITIPDSVTYIGYDAFYGCTGLTSITIPDSVTTIGNDAFSGCTSLTTITLPFVGRSSDGSDYTYLKWLFWNNYVPSSLKEVVITKATTIGNDAFYGCAGLTSITIPDSVTTIGSSAFRGCTGLTSINIGESVTTIGNSAFYGCTGLTSITIPDSVTTIGNGAFYGCSGLTSITIPGGVKTIGNGAFNGCTGLTSITIPDSVTTIGSYAFNGCKSLATLTIGNGVETIGEYAFCGCQALKSVVVPDSVTYIGYRAFAKCKSLEEITLPFVGSGKDPSGYVYNNSDYFGYIFGTGYTGGDSGYEIPASLKKVVITSATYIPVYAFMGCSTLETIIIPETVKTIGARAFCDCTSATTIYLPQGIEYIGISAFSNSGFYNDKSNWQGDALYYGDYLIKYNANGSAYVVKDGTQLIAGGAFQNCITSRVVLPDGLKYICDYAFDGCANMMRIAIPSSVVSVGDDAFNGCQSLSGVYITDLAAWCNIAFTEYESNPTRLAGNLYLNGKLVTDLVIPDSVTAIGDYAFISCTSITSVTIHDSVTTIGYDAFNGCTSLDSVVIPATVTEIGSYAFPTATVIYGYEGTVAQAYAALNGNRFVSLDRFASDYEFKVLPDGTVEITNYIGNDTQIVIPETINGMKVTSIGEYAFYFCDITSVVVHSGITNIGKNAFAYCDALEKIEIHNPMCDISDESNTIPSHVTVYGYTGSKAEMYATANTNEFVAFENEGDFVFGTCGENAKWCLDLNTGVLTIYGTGEMYNFTNVGNIAPWLADYRTQIKSVVIGDGITYIGNRAFRGLNYITSVKFGKSVTRTGYEAFYNCSRLATVELNEGLTMIGALSFYNCTALKQINIPSTVTNLANRAFKGSGLTSIVVPDTVKTLGYEVFMNCASLESVQYTKGVTMLNPRMFENCTSLKEFYFSRNMCRIRSRAFYGCTALESITFEDANNMWGSSDGKEAKIASNAFEGCDKSLQIIADEVAHIQVYAAKNGFTFVAK